MFIFAAILFVILTVGVTGVFTMMDACMWGMIKALHTAVQSFYPFLSSTKDEYQFCRFFVFLMISIKFLYTSCIQKKTE